MRFKVPIFAFSSNVPPYFFMINVGYENDKRLELVSFWRAVHLNNFNAVQSALANRCG